MLSAQGVCMMEYLSRLMYESETLVCVGQDDFKVRVVEMGNLYGTVRIRRVGKEFK